MAEFEKYLEGPEEDEEAEYYDEEAVAEEQE
jgi:hypothetical protein